MGETVESGRVLHVDDDDEFAALTAEYLERTGEHLDVETAASASDALDRLDDDTFDCIVSDYEMPVMDGLELLEAVRENDSDLPFILFTGTGSEQVASDAIARGVTDYLRKRPGTEAFELLANRIENAIEQYRATRRAERFDRLCRLVREINRVLVRAETRAEIERRVCEVISNIGPYHFAWIGVHDADTGTVEPRATAGIEAQYLDDVEITADESATGQGPTGQAIRTRAPVVVENISDDADYDPWRDDALDRGYRASAAIPLIDEDRLYGVLNVYANRTGTFDDRERDVLAELGTDIAHAIGRVDRLVREKRYERIVENLPMGVYRVAADGDIVDANAALADIYGADSADALRDHTAREFYLDEADRTVLRERLESDGLVQDVELQQRTLDGNRIWVSITAIRTETDDGMYFDGILQDITARKRRERQRRQFQSAVEHAGHVVLITDTDGTITYVNDAFEEVTGYAASEAIGRRPSMLQSGQHGDPFYRNLWETISSGEVWEGEIVNQRKDGEQYIIDQTIAPITDDEGEITGFVAINRNVTERKERELNLAFLKQAIDQAGIGIGTYAADGYATYVNERLAELFGTDRDDLRTRHMADLDPDLDRGRFSRYWASFDAGERRIYDTRIERVDSGEVIPAEIVTSRVEIDGEPYQVNTVRDATNRKRQKRELERYRSAVEHAGHSVLITDTDGIIEYVNDAFEAMSGYSAAEAIGRTPAMLRSGEHDDAFYRNLWETILAGDVWQGEVINERKDGTRYVVDQTIAPITDEGSITGFVAINRDVSALKEYERELEAQNDRLKQYGQTVAHDLRNPLALLDAELKQFEARLDPEDETVGTESVRRFCTDIGTTVDRMQALIDDLLAMAEHGQRVLAAEPTSIEAVATDAWEQIDAPAATLSVEDIEIDADPDRLRELLANLFRNSVEHGSTGSRTEAGDAVEHAGDDVHVRVQPLDFTAGFAVEDDGPGIPEDEREDVFEHGFTTAEEGTGFGLAIVEQIAEAHGWSVSVTDGRDGGARFEFRVDENV
ncbi:PAS domain S-box protein [Haloplanus aerogenes]|uniref:PAS domain S-box protein n=1 Tax=Haloplanus aerogenes TaxID=660522 RepID=A0A3M0DFE3_9EURY|nr:PAS domain S-box protein [Haloplanus aerogenes]AZH24844.1 PAS domain S-box protein [Haloplanus aerogenes]RMB13953.1 PAS domain S-box-containing protein [Haloplanus aerogenes]